MRFGSVLVLVVAPSFLACRPPASAAPAIPNEPCPESGPIIDQVVEVLIDNSASVRPAAPLRESLEDLAALAGRLSPGTRLGVRWITADSYADGNRALVGEILAIPPRPVEPLNPYDPDARKRYRAALLAYERAVQCSQESRARLVADLDRLRTPAAPAVRTDLNGAIARVSEVFEGFGPGVSRFIVIYSDLMDDVGRAFAPANGALEDAQVVVRTVRAQESPAEARAIEARFRSFLSGHGAVAQFIPMHEVTWPVMQAASGFHSLIEGS